MKALLAAGVLSLIACSTSPVELRCRRVCSREKDCAKQEMREFDRSECISECAALERSSKTRKAVEVHIRCVDKAASCRAVLNCS